MTAKTMEPLEWVGCRRLGACVIGLGLAFGAARTLPAAADRTDDAVLAARNRLVAEAARQGADAVPLLLRALDADEDIVQLTAARLLVNLDAVPDAALEQALKHPDAQLRRVVVNGLAESGRLIRFVVPIATDAHAPIRRQFFLNLMPRYLVREGHTPVELIAALASAFADADADAQAEIATALAELPYTGDAPDRAIGVLIAVFPRAVPEVRNAILESLAALPVTPASATFLREITETANGEDVRDARRILLEDKVETMGALAEGRKWRELVERFGDVDFATWPNTGARLLYGRRHEQTSLAAEGLFWRGQAYYRLKQGERAVADLRLALARDPDTGQSPSGRFRWELLNLLGSAYLNLLEDEAKAAETYAQAYRLNAPLWRRMILVLDAMDLLHRLERFEDAGRLLDAMDDAALGDPDNPWRFQYRYFVTAARTMIALGRPEAARQQYERALQMEDLTDAQRAFLVEALEAL